MNKDTDLSAVEVGPTSQGQEDQKKSENIAPDQFDEKYRTTRMEIWAYYACVSVGQL